MPKDLDLRSIHRSLKLAPTTHRKRSFRRFFSNSSCLIQALLKTSRPLDRHCRSAVNHSQPPGDFQMNTQTFSIRLAHFPAALRTVGLIALCVAAPIAAIAQQSSVAAETSSAKVSLAGLDLSTPEGLGIARDRLHDAVRLACSRGAASPDLAHQPNYVKCVEHTQARAMQQVKKPALSEVEQSGTALRSTEANNGSNRVSGAATLAAKVSLADLDLETPEGAHAAGERLYETEIG